MLATLLIFIDHWRTTNPNLIRVGAIEHLPSEILGPFPILQFFAALIVMAFIAIGCIVWLRGEKMGKTEKVELSAPRSNEAAVQLFFDGPLRAIFDQLNAIASRQSSVRLEIKDEMAAMISNAKHAAVADIKHEIQSAMRDVYREQQETNDVLKDLNEQLIRLDERYKQRRGE